MTAIERVAVIVPAHDEDRLIERCLYSVQRALDHPALSGLARRVIVVADECTDRTADRARHALERDGRVGAVLEVSFRNVGRARAAGVSEALAHWGGATPSSVWLASTDADTSVPRTWLARQLTTARAGYAGVAGIISIDSFRDHCRAVRDRFVATYAIPTDRPHPHVHGCNLGVRADAYLDAGGWPPLDSAEDHGLWEAIRARGWPTLPDIGLRVVTSGRKAGRAPNGFAARLAGLGEAS
jgi:glycosyltransferase involved in cell wall biosynthesis